MAMANEFLSSGIVDPSYRAQTSNYPSEGFGKEKGVRMGHNRAERGWGGAFNLF